MSGYKLSVIIPTYNAEKYLLEAIESVKRQTIGFKNIELIPVIVGIAVAALSGFLALRFMLKIISTVPLCRFAIYLAIIGIVYLVFQLAGSSLFPPFSPMTAAG